MITSYADIKIISSLTVAKVFLSVGLHLFCLEWKITFKLDYKFLFNPQALSLHPLHFIVLVYFCFHSYECLRAWFLFFFFLKLTIFIQLSRIFMSFPLILDAHLWWRLWWLGWLVGCLVGWYLWIRTWLCSSGLTSWSFCFSLPNAGESVYPCPVISYDFAVNFLLYYFRSNTVFAWSFETG